MHRVHFTGGLHWDENGTLIRNPIPDGKGPEWVGPPSPEMDALWDQVTDSKPLTVAFHLSNS